MYRKILKSITAFLIGIVVVSSCRNAPVKSENEKHSTIPVTITPIHVGPMVNYIELNATSVFMFKSAVRAPVTGFIENINVSQGETIEKNRLLFKIKTKEAMALRPDSTNHLEFSGVVEVNAATAGLISSIEHSNGDYVSESDQLCQIVIKDSYVFLLDVPFELSVLVKLNSPCTIALPDSQLIAGIIKSRLPVMAGNSQTERYIVRLIEHKNLPENLSGKIKIIKEFVKTAVSLPKSSILTNETMQDFWVMKLINDSIAIKIPIKTGISTEKYVQITDPVFKDSDLFLTSGNYGLGDTVYVKVLNIKGNGQ